MPPQATPPEPAPASLPPPLPQPIQPPSTPEPAPEQKSPSQNLEMFTKEERDLLEPGEVLVTVVHRHPIGIVLIYLETLIVILAIAGISIAAAPSFFSNLSAQGYRLMVALVLLAVGVLALVLFVATYIYRQSKLLVTDKSLVQIIQRGLFVRKVSRLSMSNVEDVNAEHRGILSTIFNYGILTIQTAGQEDNFIFPWCPDPDLYADRVLEARQAYAQSLEEMNIRRMTGRR